MTECNVPGFIFVWVGKRENEDALPLLWLAQWAQKRSWAPLPSLVFLDGLERVGSRYRKALEQSWSIIDRSNEYCRLMAHVPNLVSRVSEYEVKCFLRWGVLARLHRGQSCHWDGDVVWGEDPNVLTERVAGETFVLQGCPAWTMIGDDSWFDHFQQQLRALEADIDGYSEVAWKEWAGAEQSFHQKWAGTRERPLISSDQDLIRHLIHTDRLPQQKPQVILDKLKDYALFENPKYVHAFLSERPLRYKRDQNSDYFCGQKVALWHFQSDFARDALQTATARRTTDQLPRVRVWDQLRFFLQQNRGLNRRQLYRWFFEEYDFSLYFGPRAFWSSGVFGED